MHITNSDKTVSKLAVRYNADMPKLNLSLGHSSVLLTE